MTTLITSTTTTTTTQTNLRSFWRLIRRNPLGVIGLIMLVAVVGMAVLAPWIAPYDPYARVRANINTIYAPPSADHLLGTDDGGKDVLSQFMHGARISL